MSRALCLKELIDQSQAASADVGKAICALAKAQVAFVEDSEGLTLPDLEFLAASANELAIIQKEFHETTPSPQRSLGEEMLKAFRTKAHPGG